MDENKNFYLSLSDFMISIYGDGIWKQNSGGCNLEAIFLDIDGVLNTQADWRKRYTLNPLCMNGFMAYAKRCMPIAVALTSS